MDGIHDLGGREGFGRVDTQEKEEAFHSDWEARAYGIVRAMTKAPEWTLDRFRFTRERIGETNYLTRPYYDQWLQSYAALLVQSGLATVEEIASGRAAAIPKDLNPPERPAGVAAQKREAAVAFDRPYGEPFRFAAGDAVRAKRQGHAGHTRLPAYVRGARGEIVHVRGAFVFPDDSAQGIERAEPLYTVAFAADGLWPGEGSTHLVHLDLWESYLEPA